MMDGTQPKYLDTVIYAWMNLDKSIIWIWIFQNVNNKATNHFLYLGLPNLLSHMRTTLVLVVSIIERLFIKQERK